jgi:hypothetical protein
MLTRTRPNVSPDALADRLARQYGWTAAERDYHRDRLYDIRRTTALDAIMDQLLLPTSRSSANLDAFVELLQGRLADARRVVDEFDEH